MMQRAKHTLSAGFEPAREDPNGFLVHRLNHSATTTSGISVLFPNAITSFQSHSKTGTLNKLTFENSTIMDISMVNQISREELLRSKMTTRSKSSYGPSHVV